MIQLIFNKTIKTALFISFIFFTSSSVAMPPLPPFVTPPKNPCSAFELFFYEKMQHETSATVAEKVARILTGWRQPIRHSKPPEEFVNDPTCSLNSWVTLILRRASSVASPILAIQALIFIKKILDKYPLLSLTQCNTHRVFLMAFIIAFKVIDDPALARKLSWWQLGPFSTKQLKAMEFEFLHLLDWELQVSAEEFEHFIEEFWPT